MTTDWTLRPAEPGDAEALLLVHVAAIVEHRPMAYSDRQVAAWAAKTEGVDRYLDAIEDDATDLVVAVDDAVVGFGELDRADATVEAVFVDPDRGGEGIGSAILSTFERRMAADGVDVARLRAVLNAVGFYEAQGYERVERVTNETTAGVEVDSVWMAKRL